MHQLDALSKLLVLPLLAICSFQASSWFELIFLVILAATVLAAGGVHPEEWLRGLKPLRWLFLATLLLHLLLSPGRTFPGIGWLSYDGLLLGSRICAGLGLAYSFAMVLSLTTPPEELAGALVKLLSPLSRLGIDTGRVALLFGLVLRFVPVLREESRPLLVSFAGRAEGEGGGGWFARARAAGRCLEPLVLRLADRADDMALQISRGEKVGLSTPAPMSAGAFWLTSFSCLVLLLWILL